VQQKESGLYIQKPLIEGTNEIHYVEDPIKIGDSAEELLFFILRLNPQIDQISYIISYPELYHENDYLEWPERIWLPVTEVNREILQGLNSLYRRKLETLFICSSVVTRDGDSAHIPMVKLNINNDKYLTDNTKGIIGRQRGAFINAGQNYQFWGFDLMADKEWFRWTESCQNYKSELDNGVYKFNNYQHSERSLDVGFSAHNIYSLPRYGKDIIHEVRNVII